MAKTRQDLIVEVLAFLNVSGVGETPSAEDVAAVDGVVDPRVSELASRQIVYVPDLANIDDEIFDALVTVVAEASGPRFGQPRNPAARIEAENRLREIQSGDGTDTVCAKYY